MSDLDEHYRDLSRRLTELRGLFLTGSRPPEDIEFFDEYLSVNEFELALHRLCDFLLESTTPAVSNEILDQIHSLHALMRLEDDCVVQLKEKGVRGTE